MGRPSQWKTKVPMAFRLFVSSYLLSFDDQVHKKKDRRIHCVCKAQRLQQSLLFLFVFVRMRRYLTKKSRNFTAHQKRCRANNEHRCHYMTLIVGLRPLGHLSSQFHLFVVGTLHFYFFITGLFEFCSWEIRTDGTDAVPASPAATRAVFFFERKVFQPSR